MLFKDLKKYLVRFFLTCIKILSFPELIYYLVKCAFLSNTKPPKRVWLLVTNLHFLTSERSTKFFVKITKIVFNLFRSVKFSSNIKNKQNTFLKNIKKNGYSKIGFINDKEKKSLNHLFIKSTCYEDVSKAEYLTQFPKNKNSYLKTGRFFLSQKDLLNSATVIKLATKGDIPKIAKLYLGNCAKLVQINAWHSEHCPDNSEKILLQNSRIPHVDFTFLKFIKVFIFLDKITSDDGPFLFWAKSHNSRDKLKINNRRGNYSDYKFIMEKYGSPYKSILNKSGGIIFFDTSSFHCDGIVNEKGKRRVLQFEYAMSGLNGDIYNEPSRIEFKKLSLKAQKLWNNSKYIDFSFLFKDYRK